MKTRLLIVLSILALSLGLASAALAAAGNLQNSARTPQSIQTQPLALIPPGDSGPAAPNGAVTKLPGGTTWRPPQSPQDAGAWDSIAVNFPRVIQEGIGQYRMWYDGHGVSGWALGTATSTDGLTWVKDAGNPVITPGAGGSWDDVYRGQTSIFKDGPIYKMWFSGGPSAGGWQTGYATSTNGIDWSMYGGNPVLTNGAGGSWDEVETDGPAVIKDGGAYKMWFFGCTTGYTSCSIGYATSPDGESWTKYAGNPVITGTPGTDDAILDFPTVIKNGSTYMMWYASNNGSFGYTGIGLATSTDGMHWTKDPRNPVLKVGWDNQPVGGQSVALVGSTYVMWLRSGEGARKGIGYATSSNGVDWTVYAGDPLLLPGEAGLNITVNYTHDWVVAEGTPNVPITVTVDKKNWVSGTTDGNGEFRTWEWKWNDPKGVDIAPGDAVSADTPGHTTQVNPVGTIDGMVDVDKDSVSGALHAPFAGQNLNMRCEVWVDNGPPGIDVPNVSADGGSYTCDFGKEGWDLQPGQQVAVRYIEPDGDQVINVLESPWMRVNYAHDWAGANYPAGHTFVITVTNSTGEVKAVTQADTVSGGGWGGDGFQTSNSWNPQNPDIQPGDFVYFSGDDGYSHNIQVGVITGTVDGGPNDSVSGRMYAGWLPSSLNVECDPWGGPPNTPSKISSAGNNGDPAYTCQWDPKTEWDIQPGQDVAVMYIEPDGDRVMNVFQQPDLNLHLRVNYGHDWVESMYPGGYNVWITVTQSDKVTVIDTAHGQTGAIPWWGGGQTGFSTSYNMPWDSGQQPDMKAGDWVFGRVDNGSTAAVQLGVITGTVDLAADSVSGGLDTPWFTQTMDIECLVWAKDVNAPNKQSTAGPAGDPQYFCQWDPTTEWDMIAGQDVGVAYTGPDGNWVANVFRAPAPHLTVNTWADGNPGAGGNFALNVEYQNDGEAPAADTTISDTLSAGLTYLSDTSGFSHTGSGAPGDPLVWQVGGLANSSTSYQFQVFAAVTASPGDTVENTAHIDTSTVYAQGDPENKTSHWSGQVQSNDTHLNVGMGAWTGDPLPGGEFVYNINVCNNGSTASSALTLTDTLPAETTLVSWWAQHPGWTEITAQPHLLVVTRPSIPGNWCGEVYARVSLDGAAQPGDLVSNTANIAADNDLDPENNQATFDIKVGSPHNNLSIYKNGFWGNLSGNSELGGNLTPTGVLGYDLSYKNNGNQPVDHVVITNTLPVFAHFVDSYYWDNNGQHNVTPTLVVPGLYGVWDLGKLDNGYGGSLTIRLGVNADAFKGDVLTHTVTITSLPVEDDFDDNQITWVDTVNAAGPNLRLDKQNYQWWGDSTLSYDLHVSNLGTQLLQNFWITDTLPLSTTFNGDWNHNNKNSNITITVDTGKHQIIFWVERLDLGGAFDLNYRVDLDKSVAGVMGLAFTNRAAAPYPGDVYPADNADQVTAKTGPDLFVKKSLVGGDLLPGSLVTYSLKFGNAAPGYAWQWNMNGNAWLTDTLPAGLEFVSAEMLYCGDKIWCSTDPTSNQANKLGFQLWPMGPGGHNELRVTARIPDTATGLDSLVNQVVIASDQPQKDIEPDYANNSDSLTLHIDLPSFEVSKAFASTKIAGMPITYTLSVANHGFGAGTQVALQDQMPGTMTYGGGGSYQAGTVHWTLPNVGPSGQASAWFTGTLGCTAGGVVNNHLYKVSGSDQGVTSTYGAPLSFSILAPSIDVTAKASALAVKPGQTVVFTATATTNGTPLSYQWKIGATVIGSGAKINHLFAQPGTYNVVVTATDGCSFTDSYTLQVVVSKLKIYIAIVNK